MGDTKVVNISSITGYPGSQGTLTYVADQDELIISVWFGKVVGDPNVMHVPEFQALATFFEEAVLESGAYTHPAGILSIVAQKAEAFWIYINDIIWAEVDRRAFLDFIRRHAWTRTVVTNVLRPDDPTIFLDWGHVISTKDGGRVIVINNASMKHIHRIDPRDFVRAYRTSRFAGGYSLDSKPGCPSANILLLTEHGVESFFVFWPHSDEKVKISFVQMDDLVSQMERMLAWEDSHPPV